MLKILALAACAGLIGGCGTVAGGVDLRYFDTKPTVINLDGRSYATRIFSNDDGTFDVQVLSDTLTSPDHNRPLEAAERMRSGADAAIARAHPTKRAKAVRELFVSHAFTMYVRYRLE